jgi:hypothetical protein
VFLDEKYQNTKLVVIRNSGNKDNSLDVYTPLGIKPENVIFLEKTTKFKNVLVPDLSLIPCSHGHEKYSQTCNKIRDNLPDKYNFKKVFLSRIKGGRTVFGQEKVEEIFRRNGFEIICPEDYTFYDTISILKHCEVLAGCTGGGMLRSAFMPDNSTIISLYRNKVGMGIDHQRAIDMVKRHTTFYVNSDISPILVLGSKPGQDIGCLGLTCYFSDFLRDNGYKYDSNDNISREEFVDFLILTGGWLAWDTPKSIPSMQDINDILNRKVYEMSQIKKVEFEKRSYKLFGLVPIFKIKTDNKLDKRYYYFCGIKFLKIDKKSIKLFGIPILKKS